MGDDEGTKRRIEAACQVVKSFGIATECGFGRTLEEESDSILKIARDVGLCLRTYLMIELKY